MKVSTLFLGILFFIIAVPKTSGGQPRIDAVLDIYRSQSQPWLEKIAKKEFNSKSMNNSILARIREFKEIIDDSIKIKVKTACAAGQITTEVDKITGITETQYKNGFLPVKLPDEFYEKAKAAALKDVK